MKIGLTSVVVNNVKKAFKFYTEVLGFKEHTWMEEASLAIVVSKEDPKGTALLLEPNENPIASKFQEDIYREKLPVIVFTVEDIEAEYSRLSEAGVNFISKPKAIPGGLLVVLDDTCGNYIQLFQITES